MTDADLVLKKLAFVETCLADLERHAKPERLAADVRDRRFVEHTLQLAIQACLDCASHIMSSERLGEPSTNRELFATLARAGWISQELCAKLESAASLRNILVHGYTEVDLELLRDVLENHLGDLRDYVAAVRKALPQA